MGIGYSGDQISDVDEIASGTDPYDASDSAITGTIAGIILDLAGDPVSGITIVLNSTPRTTTTNADGEFTFTSVPFSSHTLSLRQGDIEVASYTLDFIEGTSAIIVINNDGSTSATAGHITTSVATQLTTLNIVVQLNADGFWQLNDAYITQRADNPSTGDATDTKGKLLLILAVVILLIVALIGFIANYVLGLLKKPVDLK